MREKNTIVKTFCAVAAGALALPAVANIAPLDWNALGADNATISSTGQTFVDIGTTLGRTDLVGIDLTVSFVGDQVDFIRDGGAMGPPAEQRWSTRGGTVTFAFSANVGARFDGGGAISAGETNAFGPAGSGLLVTGHPEAGLVVTDDSVNNPTGATITTKDLAWIGSAGDTTYTHEVSGGLATQGETLIVWPTYACPCETDGDELQVDSVDLLGYLGAWFGGCASAERTDDASVDANDLLDYLACWFPASAGGACP